MSKMFALIIVVAGGCCNLLFAQNADTRQFDIVLWGNTIGQMQISRTVEDSIQRYEMKTNARAKVLWIDRNNQTTYQVEYRKGFLYSSSVKEYENNKLVRWTDVLWDGARYQVNSYKGKRTFIERPTFSIVKLFYEDPGALDKIYYEAEAEFTALSRPKPEVREFKTSDGNRNSYYYHNARLTEVVFSVSVATAKMVPKK